jgi:hypothetical protein
VPATSKAQQRLFAIAEHNPGALYSKNKGLASLGHKTLHDFAATKTKGLPQYAGGLSGLATAKKRKPR